MPQPTTTLGNPAPTGPTQETPATGEDQLGDAGKKAIAAERDARKQADAKATALQAQLDELTVKFNDAAKANDDRSDLEKRLDALQDQLGAAVSAQKAAEEQAATATLAQLRTDRATAKGLPAVLAGKLTGTTPEELDSEIDELLPHFRQGPVPNRQQGNPSLGKSGSITSGRDRYAAAHKQ